MNPSRRDFLKGAVTAAALCGTSKAMAGEELKAVKIAKIDSFPVIYPMKGRFKFFDGPEGRPSGRPAVLVKITADDGTIGWGQSVPVPRWSYETLESVHTTIVRYLAPDLIGLDPAALNGPQFIDGSVLRKPFVVRNGELEVPDGPGLGVEVDEEKVGKILVQL